MAAADPIQQFVTYLTQIGAPGVLAYWLYTEIKERKRLQRIVESYLVVIETNARVNSALRRVVAGNGHEEG